MSRSVGQSEAKPPVFSPQASLVLIYRPTGGMKGSVDLVSQRIEPRTCGVEARHVATQPLGLFSILILQTLKFWKKKRLLDENSIWF
ncbi:hypothetical protein TNCV_4735241 [Trichonephila clavipes]|nr:hypothetical protein TNCV_4735241 [Trichonephila clavipes]